MGPGGFVVCGSTGVAGVACACCVCRWAAAFLLLLVAPTDLRPPRGLPAREPSALRAFGSARRIEARPGPAAAHGCRSLALSARWAGLKPPSPLRAPTGPRLKPASPLRAGEGGQLKPSSPLRVRNGCFWCSFRVQRRCRFQGSLVGGRAVVLLVSMSPCCRASCTKKFALCSQNTPNSAFSRANRHCAQALWATRRTSGGCGGGFAALEAG